MTSSLWHPYEIRALLHEGLRAELYEKAEPHTTKQEIEDDVTQLGSLFSLRDAKEALSAKLRSPSQTRLLVFAEGLRKGG